MTKLMGSNSHRARSETIAMLLSVTVEGMGADSRTVRAVCSEAEEILTHIGVTDDFEGGSICVPWNGGSESSLVASISERLIQFYRLGHDNQLRGDVMLMMASEEGVKIGAMNIGISDHSNHEMSLQHAKATRAAIENIKEAQCLIEKTIGKPRNPAYKEPSVPPHLLQSGSGSASRRA